MKETEMQQQCTNYQKPESQLLQKWLLVELTQSKRSLKAKPKLSPPTTITHTRATITEPPLLHQNSPNSISQPRPLWTILTSTTASNLICNLRTFPIWWSLLYAKSSPLLWDSPIATSEWRGGFDGGGE